MIFKKLLFTILLTIFTCYSALAGYHRDALAEYHEGNFESAIEILIEGLKAAPNDENMARLLGQVYFRVRDIDNALEAFKKAVSLNPQDEVSHFHIGLCYSMQRPRPAWFEASQAFAKAVELEPDNARYNYHYGNSLVMQRNFRHAQEPLERAFATEDGQNDFRIATDLGLVYQSQNNNEKAIEMFERASELNPERTTPFIYLGNLYLSERNHEKALEIADKLVEILPEDGRGHSIAGQVHLRERNFSQAEKAFTEAIQIDSSEASYYYQRGMAKEGRIGSDASSFQTLINDYAKAVTLSGGDVPADWRYRLGNAYDMEANLYWERSVRHEPSRVSCLRFLRKARTEFRAAEGHAAAQQQLQVVNERIRQLEAL
jgi:tetratricopeptide (TPR) repeat protein